MLIELPTSSTEEKSFLLWVSDQKQGIKTLWLMMRADHTDQYKAAQMYFGIKFRFQNMDVSDGTRAFWLYRS